MFTEEEISLALRAVNTERNNLAKWYGHDKTTGAPALYYTEDTVFNNDHTWQQQIDALNSFEEKIIRMNEAWKAEMVERRRIIEGR